MGGWLRQGAPGRLNGRGRRAKAWHGLAEADDGMTLPPERRGFLIELVEGWQNQAVYAGGNIQHQAGLYVARGVHMAATKGGTDEIPELRSLGVCVRGERGSATV